MKKRYQVIWQAVRYGQTTEHVMGEFQIKLFARLAQWVVYVLVHGTHDAVFLMEAKDDEPEVQGV